MTSRVFLAVATAFLAAALGGFAGSAPPSTLLAFVLFAIAFGGGSIVWQSRTFRAALPFARPFLLRVEDVWKEGERLRKSIHDEPPGLIRPSTDAERARVEDWENRVWNVMNAGLPDRAQVLEDARGGRYRAV